MFDWRYQIWAIPPSTKISLPVMKSTVVGGEKADQGFGRGEADAGVAASYDGDLSLKLSHRFNSY